MNGTNLVRGVIATGVAAAAAFVGWRIYKHFEDSRVGDSSEGSALPVPKRTAHLDHQGNGKHTPRGRGRKVAAT